MPLSNGDQVSWDTSQGRTKGTVVERKQQDFTLAGQQFRASSDDPMYVVESDKTGAKAAHRESALRRLED